MAATVMTVLAGGGSALAGALWAYVLLRTLTGMGAAGMMHVSQLLALEPVGPAWRAWAAVLLHVPAAAGGLLLAVLAWLVRLLTDYKPLLCCCMSALPRS